jgi:hypothetical protein
MEVENTTSPETRLGAPNPEPEKKDPSSRSRTASKYSFGFANFGFKALPYVTSSTLKLCDLYAVGLFFGRGRFTPNPTPDSLTHETKRQRQTYRRFAEKL